MGKLLREDIGGGVGGGTEWVFRMVGHPLLEVGVRRGEVEVVKGVVAVVQRVAGKWSRKWSAIEKNDEQPPKSSCR